MAQNLEKMNYLKKLKIEFNVNIINQLIQFVKIAKKYLNAPYLCRENF